MLEGPMVFLGFVWLLMLLVELLWGLTPALEILSITIWIIFIIDFLLKFIIAPAKWAFLKKNWLTAISLVVPAFRLFRITRLFRMFRGVRSLRLVKVVGSINRGMRGLAATMQRRGLKYVLILTLLVIFLGGAGMYTFEKDHGLSSYGESVWWTAMLITSIASDYWPASGEGKTLCLLLSIYGFCVFGYITATLASFFVGRDAEEKDAPLAGSEDIKEVKKELLRLTEAINSLMLHSKKE